MKNMINYYYNLYPNEVTFNKDKYIFDYENYKYIFEQIKRPLNDIEPLYELNEYLISKNILMHEIILNKENKIITLINGKEYILLKINSNSNAQINLPELCYINKIEIKDKVNKILDRHEWSSLWEAKIDYFEEQVGEIENKYPRLCSCINYYIGLAENASLYAKNALKLDGTSNICISHKRIKNKDTYYDLYHPLNLILDYKTRDIAEYLKSAFFCNEDAYRIMDMYFINNQVTHKEALLFFARLLYPSYFFDVYDDIINGELDEVNVERILLKSEEYETFLCGVYLYLSKIYTKPIPPVEWILKKAINK